VRMQSMLPFASCRTSTTSYVVHRGSDVLEKAREPRGVEVIGELPERRRLVEARVERRSAVEGVVERRPASALRDTVAVPM
jgi:hypothetical protein